MNYRVTVGPTAEPISIEQARTHLRIEAFGSPPAHPDDDYVEGLITAARLWVQAYLGRAIGTQTVVVSLDAFKDKIELPLAPAQSVESITYIDSNGATQSVASYQFNNYKTPAIIRPLFNQSWPSTRAQESAVLITYTAGYTVGESPDEFAVPEPIIKAMQLIIGHLYENRQEVSTMETYELPMGVKTLLQPYRIEMGV
jgi:uncharacterized phiE125 gp8 family phage protein